MRRRILMKVGLLERSFNRLSEFVYDMLMPRPSMALYSEIADPLLSNPRFCDNLTWKFVLFSFKLQSFRQKQMKFDKFQQN
jgi:hypothetical protein